MFAMFPIKMFLLNVSFIEFLICHLTARFSGHAFLWLELLLPPSLRAIGLAKEEILSFKFSCDLTRLHS